LDLLGGYLIKNIHSRVIVSIGSGTAETEMESGELCVCLDKDKKSLFTCAFAAKYLWKKHANVIFSWYDTKDGILDLLSAINFKTLLPVVVLFQHPSPSMDCKNRKNLQSTILECISAKERNVVESIHFVFDTNLGTKGNCWKERELFSMVETLCNGNRTHQVTEPSVVSDKGVVVVRHPLFGDTERRGWAKMKSGVEMSFSIL
jgi:hypothetical protein